jgi:hypothetical protein
LFGLLTCSSTDGGQDAFDYAHAISPGETWSLTAKRTRDLINEPQCRDHFKQHTGSNPSSVLRNPDLKIVRPDPWPATLQGYVGMTNCYEPRIALDMAYIYTVGPNVGSMVFMHEIVHAALCKNGELQSTLKQEQREEIAIHVSAVCIGAEDDHTDLIEAGVTSVTD